MIMITAVMVIGDDDLVLVTGDSYPYNPHSLVSPSVRVPDQIQAEVKWVHDNSDAKDDNFDDDAGDGDGYPAYSHHDKIPPWWGNVSND